ncbi:restriction endonuclease subunit S [Streptomyces sp. MUM 178J]|uniref:restriction endonuclease subunit S n=1 Tax=Streptomyces sp. MUM 178J TaxID=2791991 RepID=UPI001F03DB6F|nr:restriction endonuclease subunit S [Streptomyces sp. MUM 178J]WRQ81530.1 restriction endonuclease subunit S [Streptomyces sp. MUM 178J]
MGGLPEGWASTTLDQVCDVNGGIQKQAKRRPVENKFPFLRVANVGRGTLDLAEVHEVELFKGEIDRFRLKVGDLLVVEGNGSPDQIGRAATWKGSISDAVHQNHLIRVRPTAAVNAKFLELLWNSPLVKTQLMDVAQSSSGLYTLSTAKLKRVQLDLPPLAEQHRIVEALEEQLSRLDAAERVLRVNHARIRALAARVTNFATARAVPADQPTAPLPREADAIDRNLPRIPSSWSWGRLGDIAEVVGGVTKDKKKQLDPDLIEVPYLRVANVQRGWLDLSRVETIRVPEKKAEDLRLETGDVLMNEGGDRDKLGRGWVWRGEVKDAIHQNHVFRARIHEEVILPELLAYHANSSARWFEANGKQTTNLASISLKKIRNLPVPIPPAGEQPEILQQSGERLDGLARVGAAVEVGLKRAATLRSALLRKALTGNLIPQDPADEPAASLLARIAAEREAAMLARKAAKRAARPRKATAAAAAAAAKAAPAPTPAPSASVQQELFDQ